ncbi:MAG TPA: haloacid dehalogenase type II [Candidatus Tectomicrobia bacterium]|jgi:2-haloacid dehalogenase
MAQKDLSKVKALTFDVFGTVVDWRGSIIRQGMAFGAERGITVDWARFADDWRSGYQPAMARVRRGELPWTNIDALHRMRLDELLVQYGIANLNEADKDYLNRVWHRLTAWPDSVAGLTRLRTRYILATLSNGNVALLTNMAKYAGLPWDCILSAELARHYKPDPETYQTAADLLGLRPEQVMMVAAHKGDLRAAQAVGLQTAFVPRPMEHGPERTPDITPDLAFTMHAVDFHDLAAQLGV